MTTEPRIVERRGKVYVEYDSVGDAFSDVTAYVALRTRLAEAEAAFKRIAEGEQESYLACADVPFCYGGKHCDECAVQIARAFLEGSQEVSE